MSESKPILSGTIAVLTRGDGVVLSTAADFDQDRPGGCTVEEAQRHRVRLALANCFVRDACGADIADVIRGYDAERIVDSLCQRKGYRVTIMPAGEPR